jgi:hypothetical protein
MSWIPAALTFGRPFLRWRCAIKQQNLNMKLVQHMSLHCALPVAEIAIPKTFFADILGDDRGIATAARCVDRIRSFGVARIIKDDRRPSVLMTGNSPLIGSRRGADHSPKRIRSHRRRFR